MLISRVMSLMSIYCLPHGQYGYKGHVINLPQDIITFATSLLRLPSELDILLVRKQGSDNTHCDFRVRQSVVLRVLKWRIQLLPTGSSTTESASSLRQLMLESLGQKTTGSDLNGNIAVVHTCMALHGFRVHPKWKSCWKVKRIQIHLQQWRRSQAM